MFGACLEWEDYEANWKYNILTPEFDNFGYGTMVPTTDSFFEQYNPESRADHVVYLCYEGYALVCSTASDFGEDGTNIPRCITNGDPAVTGDLTYWETTGLLGEELESFDESYPHCLPASEWPESPSPTEVVAAERLRMIENFRLSPWALYYDTNEDSAFVDTYWDISFAEELPLFINRYGNLCTNIYDTDD